MTQYSFRGSRRRVTTALFLLLWGIPTIRIVHSASADTTTTNPRTTRTTSRSSSPSNNKYTSSIVNNVPGGALLGFDTSTNYNNNNNKKKKTLDNDNIPHLFDSHEQRYDKFAACLAATGMSVEEFQSLSMSLHRNSQLFDKVMAQAYLYRMAAKRESKLSSIFGHPLLQRQPKQPLQQPQYDDYEQPLPKGAPRKKASNTTTKRQNSLSKTSSSSSNNTNPRPKNNFRFFGDTNNDRSSATSPPTDKKSKTTTPTTKNDNKTVMNIMNGNNKAKLYQQQLQQQALQGKNKKQLHKTTPPSSSPKSKPLPTKKKKTPPLPPVKTRFDEFCASIAEIENLRMTQRRKLQKALQIDQFPAGLSLADPRVTPFLSPKVRAVVDAFPLQAEEIVTKHGLQSDEFNELIKETQTNRLFRWKVERKIRQLPTTKERKATTTPSPVPPLQAVNLKKLKNKHKRVSVEKRFHLDEPIVVTTTNVVKNTDDNTSSLVSTNNGKK